jgi:hypothetical protein
LTLATSGRLDNVNTRAKWRQVMDDKKRKEPTPAKPTPPEGVEPEPKPELPKPEGDLDS